MRGVEENLAESRFELAIEGGAEIAAAYYRKRGDPIVLAHTIFPERFSGREIGSQLARGAFAETRTSNRKLVLICPFMRAFYAGHPEYGDVVRGAAAPGEPA